MARGARGSSPSVPYRRLLIAGLMLALVAVLGTDAVMIGTRQDSCPGPRTRHWACEVAKAIDRTAAHSLRVHTIMRFAGSSVAGDSVADVDPARHRSRGQSIDGQALLLIGADSYEAVNPTTFDGRVAILVHPALRWTRLTYEPAAHLSGPEQIGIQPEVLAALRSRTPKLRKRGSDYFMPVSAGPGTNRPGTYDFHLSHGLVTSIAFDADGAEPSTLSSLTRTYSRFGETVTVNPPSPDSVMQFDALKAETDSIDITDRRAFCVSLVRYVGNRQPLTCRNGLAFLKAKYEAALSFAAARAPFDALANAAIQQAGHP